MAIKEDTRTESAAINLTDSAVSQIRKLIQGRDLSRHALRVFVSGGGCSGLQYGMALDDQSLESDFRFSRQGVEVIIDPLSMDYLNGATIDFEESLMGGGFRIENPNAVASCGCGHSFRTSESAQEESHAHGGGCACA